MLSNLNIKNYALIQQLNVKFDAGLTIITGETGAGKSILLGGLGLIMGKRADLSVVANSNDKCVVEAAFEIDRYQLKDFFEAQDLDYNSTTIIRREILPSGKSRAFVNDTPVTLEVLQLLAQKLIDIHSQHQTLELTNDEFQFNIIDALADNGKDLELYKNTLKTYKTESITLHQLKVEQAEALKTLDYNQFLLSELQNVNLENTDLETLEQEFETLNNVEFIAEQLSLSQNYIAEENFGLIGKLTELKQMLSKISGFNKRYEDLKNRIESILIELKDIHLEIESETESLETDPSTLEAINEKLQLFNNLFKKHAVDDISGLINIKKDLENAVDKSFGNDNQIKQLEQSIEKLNRDLLEIGNRLHQNRVKAIPVLIEKITSILTDLGMPNSDFKIDFEKTKEFKSNGLDNISFLFSANKGMQFQSLKKSASGGELSRIMMAIKTILSNYIQMPTLMFDEIDTGVSGEIANKMADTMIKLSKNMQVFAITHLPQIAAKGQAHFKVYKHDTGSKTETNLKLLSENERINEIAQMLSGSSLPSSAIAHAKQLLN
ncbi:DNA repair protein RecN [Paucihalobacter ruber]|uniref:DNA repair protein RecN n=1 Tax=Paucihalobacter ruber TaxID=2567861 RepID=A0A506PIT0_9FLAO|nr:DNA repair protein RecN [Paucihalobacter ruber]TPV32290.1 DNA repair protein RecN [Paucihalobacter ruber]